MGECMIRVRVGESVGGVLKKCYPFRAPAGPKPARRCDRLAHLRDHGRATHDAVLRTLTRLQAPNGCPPPSHPSRRLGLTAADCAAPSTATKPARTSLGPVV